MAKKKMKKMVKKEMSSTMTPSEQKQMHKEMQVMKKTKMKY